MSKDSLWLVKGKNGRVRGPLSTSDIIQMIHQENIVGEESISLYPNGKWKPISVEPVFYDNLMGILSHTESSSATSQDLSQKVVSTEESATIIADQEAIRALKKKRKNKDVQSFQTEKYRKKRKSKTQIIYDTQLLKHSQLDDEEKKITLSNRKYTKRLIVGILIASTVAVVAFVFFSQSSSQSNQEFISLKLPRDNQPTLGQKEVNLLIKNGLAFYFRSHFSSYVRSQDLLVQAVEGNQRNIKAMAFLCLVHLELWPFSRHDFYAMRVISRMIHKTSLLDQGGIHSGVCQIAESLIKGEYNRAKNMVDSGLNGLQNQVTIEPSSQSFLSVLYYLKALSLYYLGDYATAVNYLDTCRHLLPKWIQPWLLTGEVFLKQNKPNAALSIYNRVLKLHATHKTARIRAGLIEFKKFNKIHKAENLLITAVNDKERVSHSVISDAYLGLSEIFLKKNEVSKALMYARQAYSYNPTNKISRNLIIELGGLKDLNKIKVKGNQLIYKADQLVLDGKIRAAIGYYEEAFKISGGKNSLVAIKAAKSLFQLNLFDEAIAWLKKAIEADPYMMESYVLMSNFYTTTYDFYNAAKILKIGSRKSPGNYAIARGWAYLNLKQGAYQRAIQYAKRALKLYEADVESLIILSEAYSKINKINESLIFSTRAKEMEPNSTLVQITFAKALGNIHGVDTGVHYFKKLISNYPLILEYQMALAKYLFEDDRYSFAKSVLQGLIAIQPSYTDAYFYLGRVFMYEENYSGAYEAFLQAAVFNPTDPKPVFYIGQLRLKEKKYQMAEKFFKKVIALNSLYPKIYFYLGQVSFSKGDYQKAIYWARLETKTNPNLPAPLELAGRSYEKLSQFRNCADEYQKAIEKDPNNFYFYIRAARCYRKSGLLDLAVAILLKASENNSGQPDLYKELAVIYKIRGAFVDAASSYCNYLKLKPTAADQGEIRRKITALEKQIGKKIPDCDLSK